MLDLDWDFELLKIPAGLLFIVAFAAALFLTVP